MVMGMPSMRAKIAARSTVYNAGSRDRLVSASSRLRRGLVGGCQIILKLSMAELVDRADRTEQAKAVAVVQERHQPTRQ